MRSDSISPFSSRVVKNVIFPLWVRKEHPLYTPFRLQLQKSQFFGAEQLRELQLERLRKILRHANEHCAFYSQRLHDAGLSDAHITAIEDITALPVVTKKDIQDFGARMLADNIAERDRVRNQTGGSTGSPIQFYVDKGRFGSRLATAYRTDAWAGLHPGDWHAYLWGAQIDLVSHDSVWDKLRKHLLYRRIQLNTSSIGEKDWRDFLAQLRRFRPRVFVAYAQAAVLFANYVREHKIEDIRFNAVITTAEVLSPADREVIESVFSTRVFNRYGCREVSTIAAECEYHTGLHISAESLLVEIVPDVNAPPGMGKIVVTDLLNRSMPLIRYEIGDVGAWSEVQDCPCGRRLPLLSALEGRITDFITLSDDRKLSGVALLTWVFAQTNEVRQVQFIQHAPGDLTLRYVPGPAYAAGTENMLRQRLGPYIQGQARLTFERVSEIRKETSGKFRFIVHSPRMVQENPR